MTGDASLRNVLVGTAGHVDHGKTRLVARLTGIDTDRLPEEKARGISIDLGFAHWRSGGFRFGVVDVPGHERFVHNMVAGATGVDVALLVVAADDGVMPQTREHLDVMNLLGLRAGVVAVTKVDLVDEEMVELVVEDVRALVRGTFLDGAAIVPVSAVTGDGVPTLEAALVAAAERAANLRPHALFRMPIDRVFTLEGRGTIVTGSTLSGSVRPGDTLVLLPGEREVRVRSVESHGETLESGGASARTALNLAGVARDDVERGMELATIDTFRPTRRLVVELDLLRSSPIPIRSRDEFRLHLGTAEVTARVVLKPGPLEPGGRAFAELRTREPVVAEFGQRFLLRRTSPAATIAGGRVLDPFVPDRTRLRDLNGHAEALAIDDPERRLSAVLSRLDEVPDDPQQLVWRVGTPAESVVRRVGRLVASGELLSLPGNVFVHRDRLDALASSIHRAIRIEVERQAPRRTIPRATARTLGERMAPIAVVDAALDRAVDRGDLVESGGNVGPAEFAPKMTKREREALERAIAAIVEGEMTPPPLRELATLSSFGEERLAELLGPAEEEGQVVRVSAQLWMPPEILGRYRRLCEDKMNESGEATLSGLREVWGVTRKWAVPVAEHLDATGVTVREGDVRRLRDGRV